MKADGGFAPAIKALTDGEGADVVIDTVGSRVWRDGFDSLRSDNGLEWTLDCAGQGVQGLARSQAHSRAASGAIGMEKRKKP